MMSDEEQAESEDESELNQEVDGDAEMSDLPSESHN